MSMSSDSASGPPTQDVRRPENSADYVRPKVTIVGPVAFVAYAWLLRVAPIPLVATYSYVNPLVAIVLGYFLGKEIITSRLLVAAGLVIGSVVLVSTPKR